MTRIKVAFVVLAAPLFVAAIRPETGLIEAIGVCKIDESGADCWDLQGRPNADVSSEVNHSLLHSGEVRFLPGRKNRFLIVRQTSGESLAGLSASQYVAILNLGSEGGTTLTGFRLATDSLARTDRLVVTASTFVGQPVEMPFRDGASAQVEDVHITLGPVADYSDRQMPGFFGYGSKRWRFGAERTETPVLGSLSYEALDSRGETIQYVDLDGMPIEGDRAKSIIDQIAKGSYNWLTMPYLENASFTPVGGLWITTNVSPKVLAKLKVRRIVDHPQSFGPFPLDPIQSKTP